MAHGTAHGIPSHDEANTPFSLAADANPVTSIPPPKRPLPLTPHPVIRLKSRPIPKALLSPSFSPTC